MTPRIVAWSFAVGFVGAWTASAADPGADAEGRPAASIVGAVGDEVILLEEVMGSIQGQLRQAKAQLPPDQYREYEWNALRQVTQQRIQRTILLKELEAFLPNKDILPRIKKRAAEDFENYLTHMAHESGLKNRDEVIEQLKKDGADLNALRRDFVDNVLAQQYMEKLVKPHLVEPTRDQLMDYYLRHAEEFAEPAGATWRHVQVRYGNDKKTAEGKIRAAYDRLAGGDSFEKVAKQFSDGPTAADGGRWSVTSPGSYADPAVDHVLFSLPVGQHSQVFAGKDAFHIVVVEKRSDGKPKPFEEVQGPIKNRLMREQRAAIAKKKIEEIATRHHVETIFDNDAIRQVSDADAARRQ